jgi:DNA polymerase III delta prime subunit
MNILEHLEKGRLHHAYLIQGSSEEILPQILEFWESIGVKTVGNSDFVHIHLDSFKIEDARNLKSFGMQKSYSSAKKIFVISTNNFLLEAQNSLLKMFEEPISDTHFFIILPDVNVLLDTFISRFYLIKSDKKINPDLKKAEEFIKMPLKNRIDFIKELLTEEDEENGEENLSQDSTRSKAIKFLNSLEAVLHKKFIKNQSATNYFEQIFKVREFLRMPGSATKSLMESVALIIPNFSN